MSKKSVYSLHFCTIIQFKEKDRAFYITNLIIELSNDIGNIFAKNWRKLTIIFRRGYCLKLNILKKLSTFLCLEKNSLCKMYMPLALPLNANSPSIDWKNITLVGTVLVETVFVEIA